MLVPVLVAALVILAIAASVLGALFFQLQSTVASELRASQGLRDKLTEALATLTTRGASLESALKDLSTENTSLVKLVSTLAPQTQHQEFLEGQVQKLQSVVIGTLKENADLAQTRIMSLLDVRASALAHGQVRERQEAAGFTQASPRPRDTFSREVPENFPPSPVDEAPRGPRRRPGENRVVVPLSPAFEDSPYAPEEELTGVSVLSDMASDSGQVE